jgi:hypothetical protein
MGDETMKTKQQLTGIILGLFLALLGTAGNTQAQVAKFDGKPVFAEGIETGYYVWRDGDKWSVRWTTTGKMRHFTGHVAAEGGELKSLKRIDVEEERRVLYPGRAPHVAVGPRGRVYRRGGRPPVVATREQDKFEKVGDNRIAFNARTDDDIDGFDFKVDANVTRLRFVLEIDGQLRPMLIEAGRNNYKPEQVPFVVNLK